MALNIGILIFDQVEVLDFCGPFEVFSTAVSLSPKCLNPVKLIAETPTVTTNGGMVVEVGYVIGGKDAPKLDILLVPGGYVVDEFCKHERVIEWIKEIRPSLKYVLSVCTGTAILGKCGIVDDLVITTHHMLLNEVAANCPHSTMCTCRRFIDNDTVYTAAGISAGIDMSLYFLKKHFGNQIMNDTVKMMEYNWTDPDVASSKCVCGAEEVAASKK